MNVVIYARVASCSESDSSIDRQISECVKFAEANGHVIVGRYSDVGIKCANVMQSEFWRMKEELESNNAQAVIVSCLHRFSRNRKEAMECKISIEESGIQLLSVLGTDMYDNAMHELVNVHRGDLRKEIE